MEWMIFIWVMGALFCWGGSLTVLESKGLGDKILGGILYLVIMAVSWPIAFGYKYMD
jgi:hypothetical protein